MRVMSKRGLKTPLRRDEVESGEETKRCPGRSLVAIYHPSVWRNCHLLSHFLSHPTAHDLTMFSCISLAFQADLSYMLVPGGLVHSSQPPEHLIRSLTNSVFYINYCNWASTGLKLTFTLSLTRGIHSI